MAGSICGPAFLPRNCQTAIKPRFLRQSGLMHRMMSPNLLLDYRPLRRGRQNTHENAFGNNMRL